MKSLVKRFGVFALVLGLGLSFGMAVQAQETSADGRQATPAANPEAANAVEKDENEAYKHSAMVQKMGHMLGMSTATAATTFEVLNFAVLALAVGFFVAKLLPKTFRDRTSAIQKDLADARSATEEATVRLNSVEDRLAKLDGQIADMRAQAEKDALVEETRVKAAAEEERNKILASAEQEIASATQQAQRQLQQYAASLAIEQAAKRLVISAETDRLIVKNFAQRLGEGKGDN